MPLEDNGARRPGVLDVDAYPFPTGQGRQPDLAVLVLTDVTQRVRRIRRLDEDLEAEKRARHAGDLVEIAPDGEAGLARLRVPPSPDVLLIDLLLPGLSGRELVDHLAGDAHLAAIPVIVMTTSSRTDVLPREGGYARRLRKPFPLNDLFAAIRQVTGLEA